jgi:nucleoside-diphosphate-sugar epimerase
VSGETIAITGGTGFVGQTLIRLALEQGFAVRALARMPQEPKTGVIWISGALNTPEALRALVSGSDAIIHVAGVVNAANRAGFEAGNVAGTLAVIEGPK